MQKQVSEQRALAGTNDAARLPEQICLRTLGETWTVAYAPNDREGVDIGEQPDFCLRLNGEVDDHPQCHLALQRWVRRKAHVHLVPWLEALSREQELPWRAPWCGRSAAGGEAVPASAPSASIRSSCSSPRRWCTTSSSTSLCHTLHFDHSAAFWKAMHGEPRGKLLDAELNTAWRYVPVWMSRS